MTTDVRERRTTYREVFAEPTFRVLFASRSLAIAATTLRIVALSVLVYSLTGSTLLSAITFGIGFLPQIVGGMLLGSLADRVRPRRLIAAGYLLECAAAIALAQANLPVAGSLVLVAVVAMFTPVFNGASSRLVAEVLTGDAYVLGRSLSTVASASAQLIGMACAGLAVASLGPRHALLVSAGCHLIAALTVRYGLRNLPAPPPADGERVSALRQTWTVNVHLMGDRSVRRLLFVQWFPAACITGAEALLVPYAARRGFPYGAAGVLLACVPIGMLIGDLIVGRFLRPRTRERLVPALLVLLGAPVLLVAVAPSEYVVAALLVLTGAGFSYSLGLQREFLEALPEAYRGQGFGLLTTGLMTLQGLGPAAFGVLGQVTSPGTAIAVSGAATVLMAIMWATSQRRLRRPTPATAPRSA